ncbi:DNA-binding transcriptional MerR regulator [Roseovarius sp. MBR-78]|jgi:DNA-binding transcriptional MerR regulator|uniref:MerR family transcriptional regulator n=1 Tax=Roseovarius sp. MBR-78 TaxID=3156460 RepID=UPI00339B837B
MIFAIGELARRTGVKVPTIRYYEARGLLGVPDRSAGNQRRYGQAELERLRFIRHARDLGFSLAAISALIELQTHPDRTCDTATRIARDQLDATRRKIRRLRALEAELDRITQGCTGDGPARECYVLASLADHELCETDHAPVEG